MNPRLKVYQLPDRDGQFGELRYLYRIEQRTHAKARLGWVAVFSLVWLAASAAVAWFMAAVMR